MWDKALYTQGTSIIHHLIYETNYFVGKIILESSYKLTDSEKNNVSRFLNINSDLPKPKRSVFIVLLESFEGWALTSSSMPNLYEFAHSENVLYAKKLVSQTRGGTSGDGQMIVNTGLLPTKEGAVCFRYHTNKFPSISELYDNTFNIIPGGNSVWNQGRMNIAYSINNSLEIGLEDLERCEDKTLVDMFLTNYKNYNYGMLLTVSTHSPFKAVSNKSEMRTPEDMPIYLANYLKSFNYSDSSLKGLIDSIKKDEYLKQSVIIFTGDHIVFHKSQRESFNDYCKRNNLPYDVNEGYTSFIMYSPDIEGNIVIEEEAYQMDIYPTIMDIIGCEEYFWKGVGVNVMDSAARNNRPILEKDAYDISDMIIRSNYFNLH
jgi:phosphoglycerol transferase MdoB-like AlkP superfamily enzyme